MTIPVRAPDLEHWRAQVKCQVGCLVSTDAGRYVQLIADGRDEDAFLVARAPNPFASICGRVCAAPCEDQADAVSPAHREAAHLMVVAVVLHLARVFFTGAYKNGVGQGQRREWNWVIGVVMLLLTLFLSFTGYLLPWDQLAYWAVTVGTSRWDRRSRNHHSS